MAKSKAAEAAAILEGARIHFAQGALEDQDVAVGEHLVGPCRVVIQIPDGAKVIREEGTTGDGFNETLAKAKGQEVPSLAAVLLFLERIDAPSGPHSLALWVECIRDAHERGLKGEDLVPAEAKKAMVKVHGQPTQTATSRKRTPANRLGVELAKVTVEKAA